MQKKKTIKKTKTAKNKKVVYTYGVFDLFHSGHLDLLKEAKELGDILIVGLFTDEVAESFKRKPVISLSHRIKVLENIKYVDKVIIQDELHPDKNILSLRPHILAKGPGAGWEDGKDAPGKVSTEKVGGKIVMLNYHHGISTSEIIKKIKESK